MKNKVVLLLIFFLPFGGGYAQTVIESPTHGYCNEQALKLRRIELSDTATILHFQVLTAPGTEIYVPDDAFIQPVTGGERLTVRHADGIPLNQEYVIPAFGQIEYRLIFPAIGKQVERFDFIEGEDGWTIFDIQVRPNAVTFGSMIPQDLSGDWFNDDTGDWEVSFFENRAVYKKQLWNYGNVRLKRGSGTIQLGNGSTVVELFLTRGKNGTYTIGETSKQTKRYCRSNARRTVRLPDCDKPFENVLFALDTAVYSGYIRYYRPHLGSKTLLIRVNDILTGGENVFVANIADNGYFSVKVPLYHSQDVYIGSSAYYNDHVFLEPGKELFQMVDVGTPHFMGDGARVNTELQALKNIHAFNHDSEINKKINDITADGYKAYWLNWQERDLRILDSIAGLDGMCPRTLQIKRTSLLYEYLTSLMDYEMLVENASSMVTDTSDSLESFTGKNDSSLAAHFDFITDQVSNDSRAVIGDYYYYFLNRLSYSNLLRSNLKWSLSFFQIVSELKKSGYRLTADEECLLENLKELDSLQAQDDFRIKYKAQIESFEKKYSGILSVWYSQLHESPTFSAIEKHLLSKNAKFTAEEILFLHIAKANDGKPTSVRIRRLLSETMKAIGDFNKTHVDFLSALHKQQTNKSYLKSLDRLLGVKPGLATDIIVAQSYCRSIVNEKTPAADWELNMIGDQLSSNFVKHYVVLRNQQTINQLESNSSKIKPVYDANEQPKIQTDAIFDTIIARFKGKVIYIDFWATWCAPCLSDIREIEPLKDEMEKENVTFVYITDQTSPKKTWLNMMSGIKGEHYRVSSDEWNYLCRRFNIAGIPHKVLVGKNGEVVNHNLSLDGNALIKKELIKYIDR